MKGQRWGPACHDALSPAPCLPAVHGKGAPCEWKQPIDTGLGRCEQRVWLPCRVPACVPFPVPTPPPPFMASLTGAKTVCLLPGTALNSTPLQAQHPAALLAPTGRIYFCLAFILATNNGSRSQHPISPSLPRPPASTWRRRKGGRGWGGSRRQSCVCGAESSAVISWCCWLGNCTSCTSPLGLSSGL